MPGIKAIFAMLCIGQLHTSRLLLLKAYRFCPGTLMKQNRLLTEWHAQQVLFPGLLAMVNIDDCAACRANSCCRINNIQSSRQVALIKHKANEMTSAVGLRLRCLQHDAAAPAWRQRPFSTGAGRSDRTMPEQQKLRGIRITMTASYSCLRQVCL